MGLFGVTHGRGETQKAPLKPVTQILNGETWHSYTLPKENPKKYINHVTYCLSSADISIFSTEISNFCYIKKYGYRLHFNA